MTTTLDVEAGGGVARISALAAMASEYGHFCCGLLIDDADRVLLVDPPTGWPSGGRHGPSAAIRKDESPEAAVSRATLNATGTAIPPYRWRRFAVVNGGGAEPYRVDFLVTRGPHGNDADSRAASEFCIDTAPSLSWLLPLALDHGVTDVVVLEERV